MTIEQHIWGSTPEGEAIVIYTMRNGRGSEVRITNLGAAVVGVSFADRSGKIDDVVLGYRDALSYMHDGAASGKSVGRVANRIANGHMTVEGKDYSLEINNGPNHLHGGTDGFANRIWDSYVEGNRVICELHSDDMDQGYPHALDVQAVFDFDEDDSFEITYSAESDGTTPVNLTNHTYWNLSGEASGTILDHELHLECSKVLEMNEVQIPTGKLLDVKGTPQDFTSWRRLGDDIKSEFNHMDIFRGYDHFFVVDKAVKNILSSVGTLRDPKSGRKVEILSSAPGCMVYTGNWLSGGCPITKSGGRYPDYAGVAIECQIHPDAVNHPEFPSVLLHAKEMFRQKIVFRLGTF